MPAKFSRRPFLCSSVILFTQRQNDHIFCPKVYPFKNSTKSNSQQTVTKPPHDRGNVNEWLECVPSRTIGSVCQYVCNVDRWRYVPSRSHQSLACHTASTAMAQRYIQIHTQTPAQLPRPTGFLCGWSVGLEFPAGQLAESDYWREQFQTISEDVSVRNVLMHSAH